MVGRERARRYRLHTGTCFHHQRRDDSQVKGLGIGFNEGARILARTLES